MVYSPTGACTGIAVLLALQAWSQGKAPDPLRGGVPGCVREGGRGEEREGGENKRGGRERGRKGERHSEEVEHSLP